MESFTPNVSVIQQNIVRITVLNVQSCDLFIKDIQDPQEMQLLHPDLETAQHTCEFLQDALQGKDGVTVSITNTSDPATLNFCVTRATKYNTKTHTLTLVERSQIAKYQQPTPSPQPVLNNNSPKSVSQPSPQQQVVSPRARVDSRGGKGTHRLNWSDEPPFIS